MTFEKHILAAHDRAFAVAAAMPDQFLTVARALTQASLALSASHGLLATDRSDLPRNQWPMYRLDHSADLRAIDAALAALVEASTGIAPANPVVIEAPL